jgi:hypothetical protein
MNFYHVLWTVPMKKIRWYYSYEENVKMTIYYYGLSVAYLKNLNQKIDLYTDSEGKKILEHLPYDNIYVVLDDMDENIPGCNWAAGKIESFKYSKLGDIYIDGDVFIKRQECLDKLLENTNYDGYFAGLENPHQLPFTCEEDDPNYELLKNKYNMIYWDYNKIIEDFDFPLEIPVYGMNACNGGLVVFNNQEYKDKYLYAYDYMMKQIKESDVVKEEYNKNFNLCLDLITEQRFFYEIGKEYKLGFLLDYWKRDDDISYRLNKQANSIGFQHVLSSVKYDLLDKCILNLKNVDKNIYDLCCEKANKLCNL